MPAPGLDEDGYIKREGDLTRIPQAFAPVAQITNGDLGDLLPRWRAQLSQAGTEADLKARSRRIFGHNYPARRDQMEVAAAVAKARTVDREVLGMLIDDLGPWLATEYLAVHGRKTPRP